MHGFSAFSAIFASFLTVFNALKSDSDLFQVVDKGFRSVSTFEIASEHSKIHRDTTRALNFMSLFVFFNRIQEGLSTLMPQSTPKHAFTGFGPNAESDSKTHRSYGGKQKKSVYLCSVVIPEIEIGRTRRTGGATRISGCRDQ